MARKRKKGSTRTLGGLGLEPDEDTKLTLLLEHKDVSLQQLLRKLTRDFIRENEKLIRA